MVNARRTTIGERRAVRAAVLACALAALGVAGVADAVIMELTVKGTVSSIDAGAGRLTLTGLKRYGCAFREGGRDCTWSDMDASEATGTVPLPAALEALQPGDRVIATSAGGLGGRWVMLAPLADPAGEERVTGIFGQVRSLPELTLMGGYSLQTATAADCSRCRGTVCAAASAEITLNGPSGAVLIATLAPGDAATFEGVGGIKVSARFVEGQALSGPCRDPGAMRMVGPQAFSIYEVHARAPTIDIDDAREIAAQYFEALISGDADKANEFSAVPFSLDGKRVITELSDLDQAHRDIVGNQGKRKVPEYTMALTHEADALDPGFPEHLVIRITLHERRDRIDLYIRKAPSPAVVGFRD